MGFRSVLQNSTVVRHELHVGVATSLSTASRPQMEMDFVVRFLTPELGSFGGPNFGAALLKLVRAGPKTGVA